jgi:hypothetical protein
MMNVNMTLNREELEAVGLSLRAYVHEMKNLANAECLDVASKERYQKTLDMLPKLIDVFTTLQVKRILHDCGLVEPVTV